MRGAAAARSCAASICRSSRRGARHHGAERLRQEHAGARAGRSSGIRGDRRARSLYDGQDLLAMDPETRARAGVFMAFQYPVEIPGVNNAYFLKAALNALRKHRGQEELDAMEFMALVRDRMKRARHRRDAAEPAGERRVLGRREEAQRDLPDGRAGAEAGDPRRDRLRPRHRRAEDRRARRERDAAARIARSCS